MPTQTEPKQQTEPERIEGLGDQSEYMDHYPIDTLLIRTESRTVHDVLRRMGKGDFVMDPDFQRDFIWDDSKQSKLMESVIMRIPLPVFYLAEDDMGRSVVVDGLQRLTTFERFVSNKLKLMLPEHDELNGLRFKDLPNKLQNRIEDCNLILYITDSKVPERARLDMFERVNGGVPLSRQQMRNCLFMGEGTKFLKRESRTSIFLRATGNSLRTDKMRDREFVNRFCAFQLLDLDDYKDMDDFLATGLRVMDKESLLFDLSHQFRNSLSNNLYLFGKHAFRKHVPHQENRGVLNASLWDVMSTGLSKYSTHLVLQHARDIKKAFYGLLSEDSFVDAITRGPNSPKQVKSRFIFARQMFREVLGAHED